MMSDDWSLKDKRYMVWDWNEAGIEKDNGKIQSLLNIEKNCFVYDAPTIDILREKLIEDIDKATFELGGMNASTYDKMIEIINKRFGVKE